MLDVSGSKSIMTDLYHRAFQSAYHLPFSGYPYHGHLQYPPPYSHQPFPPPFQPGQRFAYPHTVPIYTSSHRRQLSRDSSAQIQRHISDPHSRIGSLKKLRKSSHSPAFISDALHAIQLAIGRPHGWRSGYTPPSKPCLGKLFECFSLPTTPSCLSSITLHFLLRATQEDLPNIVYDLRKPQIEDAIFLPYFNRTPNMIDFCQLITSPPIHHMTLWHRKLPWCINIEASQPNGITLYDFFRHIYQQLHQPIAQEDYYTDELAASDREMLMMAFQVRCAMFPDQSPGGIRRIDFLGSNVCFTGLKCRRGGSWEFKTELPAPKERMIID